MADDKLSNFIAISRKIFDHEFWEEDRIYSKFEAWVDLIQSASYAEDVVKTEWINNKEVKYSRGQLIASVRYLQKRWNWGSITKVERFLSVLKNKDMVVSEKGQGVNVITICKYDTYNPKKNNERTVKGQGRGQQKDKTNKVNKDNKEIYKYLTPNILLSELKNSDFESGSDELEYFKTATAFVEVFKSNKTLLGLKNIDDLLNAKYKPYTDPIRLMRTIEKVEKEDLLLVHKYLKGPKSIFWKKNIFSTSKLREQFERLLIEAKDIKPIEQEQPTQTYVPFNNTIDHRDRPI
jgi:hypothetical protein